jgi:group I intron endonuclease
MVVYWVRNTVNDKVYIGQTSTSLEKRWYMHTWDRNSNSVLHKSIVKYGKEKFKIEAIHECESKEEMDFVETFYIDFLVTKSPNGYNLTDGGDGRLGMPCSEETKKKIGFANKGKPTVNNFKSGSENPMFGKHLSEDHKECLRKANKGHKRSYGNKNALGHIVSEETRELIRQKRLQFPKKTHCVNGHERIPENVYKSGVCKLCQVGHNARRKAASA